MTNSNLNAPVKNPWKTYSFILGSVFFMLVILGMNTPAYPLISEELGISAAYIAWMSAAYSMSAAVLAPMMGRIGDLIGIRKVLLGGLFIFSFGCAVVWIAPNYPLILLGRFVQGLGVASIFPATMSFAGRFFPRDKAPKVYTAFGAVCTGGVIFGPVLSGFIVANYGWRYIYAFGTVVMGIAFLINIFIMPQVDVLKSNLSKFDYAGSITLFIAIGSILVLPTLASQIGWTSIPAYILITLFVIFITVFIKTERKSKNPLMNIKLILSKEFSIPSLFYMTGAGFSTALLYLLSYFIVGGLGFPATITGYWTMTVFVVSTAAASVVGKLLTKLNWRSVAFIPALLWTGTIILFATMDASTPIYLLFTGAVTSGLAMSFGTPLNTSAAMNNVSEVNRGSASGTFRMIGDLGAPIFVAIFVPLLSVFGKSEQGPNFAVSFPKVAMFMLIPAAFMIFLAFIYPKHDPKVIEDILEKE